MQNFHKTKETKEFASIPKYLGFLEAGLDMTMSRMILNFEKRLKNIKSELSIVHAKINFEVVYLADA